jgi:hypothetical protein
VDWLAILTDLVKTALGAVLFFIGTLFWRQPRVEVTYNSGSGGSKAGSTSNTLLCYWNGYLLLYNPSPHDAFELTVDIRPKREPLRVEEVGQKHLRATDSLKIPLHVEQELPKEEVVAARSTHRANELEPAELKNLECLLSYRNAWGKRFYTRFRRTGAGHSVTYHRWKPKVEAS